LKSHVAARHNSGFAHQSLSITLSPSVVCAKPNPQQVVPARDKWKVSKLMKSLHDVLIAIR
jgi:hypothetical protein